jgi:hypothetical protein
MTGLVISINLWKTRNMSEIKYNLRLHKACYARLRYVDSFSKGNRYFRGIVGKKSGPNVAKYIFAMTCVSMTEFDRKL